MGKNKQIVINMITQMISFIINIAISFFLTSFIVEKIGKEVFGFWGLANNFISYITVFTVALNSMLSRFVTIKLHQNDLESANKYFSSVAIANIALSLILSVPTAILILFLEKVINIPGDFIFDVKLLWLFLFFSFFLSLSTSVFDVATFAKNRLDLAASINIKSNILRASLLIVLYIYMSPHLWYIGFTFLICTLYVVFAKFHFRKKLTPELIIKRNYFDWKSMKELLAVGFWNSINQLNSIFMTGLDLLITNIFIGATDMSMLSVAKTIPMQLQTFVQMIANTFTPQLTITYAKKNLSDFIKQVIFSMKITGFLGSVPIIGLVVFGQNFFSLWLNSLSHNEIIKVQILSILTLLPMLCNTFVNPLFNVNTITAKVKLPVITNLVIGVLNICIVYLLIKYTDLGVFAVAGVSAIMVLVRMILFVPIYAAYILNVKWYTFYWVLLRGTFALVILTITFMTINHLTNITSWFSFVIICILTGLFGYILNFFIIFNNYEKSMIINMLKRKLTND
ncbi:putative membrane protein EpsK [Bacillus rhizoplanae]|uniref:Membrane protein EpsK n=1 Tax=Bacillus rhizoplanae TaxID=2880966 RepID=A0ABM8Y8Q2_9BACI|nr:hypothetical protein [Bacillus rhizoplanae]CAG9612124.1 putative membrane protein EpsK [Bacillus rhizoplanae]